MRLKFPVSAAVAVLVVFGATASWAEKGSGRGKKSSTDVVPESVNRQFQWEEKVVGPKNQGVDHKKIAAMQEQARREDAARKKLPPPKKPSRAEGIAAPASSTLPTMDIEKPAPAGTVRKPSGVAKKAEEPRRRDALDNLLAEEGAKPAPRSSPSSSHGGLGSILAVDDTRKPAAPAPAPLRAAKKPAHKHRR